MHAHRFHVVEGLIIYERKRESINSTEMEVAGHWLFTNWECSSANVFDRSGSWMDGGREQPDINNR
jgi:hypothetical protein